MYDLAENDDFDREMIATYEEVAKLFPRPEVLRPIGELSKVTIGTLSVIF